MSEEGPRAHLDVYGFVRADSIYDANRMDPEWDATLRPSKIPVNRPAAPGGLRVPLLGWLLYYDRQWNERWTSSIGFSEHREFTTAGQADDAFELGQYGNVNLLFHPTPQMFVGPEFVWGRLRNEGGKQDSDSRVQVSFHYDFSATIFGGAR